MQISSSTACMCMPKHSQSSYCDSDYGKCDGNCCIYHNVIITYYVSMNTFCIQVHWTEGTTLTRTKSTGNCEYCITKFWSHTGKKRMEN